VEVLCSTVRCGVVEVMWGDVRLGSCAVGYCQGASGV
jgi:hypothetical protein